MPPHVIHTTMIFCIDPSEATDKVRMALENSSAFWFNLVKYSSFAVALGCALETPEAYFAIKKWRSLGRGREPRETDEPSWVTPVSAIGLLIVVLGIVTETIAESRVSSVDTSLRAYESEKITAAEGRAVSVIYQAGSAKDSAVSAATAAERADKVAITARLMAEAAEGRSRAAGKRAEAANKIAGSAVTRAEESNLFTNEVEKRRQSMATLLTENMNARSMDYANLAELLKGKAKGRVHIWYEPYDAEVEQFVLQLRSDLEKIGWEATSEKFKTNHVEDDNPHTELAELRRWADLNGYAMQVASADLANFDSDPYVLLSAILSITGGGTSVTSGSSELAPNQFILVIGPHRPFFPLHVPPPRPKPANTKTSR